MTFSVHTLYFIWKALSRTVSLSATFCMATDSENSATAGIGQWGEDPPGSHRLKTNWKGEGKKLCVSALAEKMDGHHPGI